MKNTFKTAKTIKEYKVNYNGYDLIIPVGSTVNNRTACGNDDNYRFLQNFNDLAEKVTTYKHSMLLHDLTYYGLNIPAEFCEPYQL
jgi:hypothetical protein